MRKIDEKKPPTTKVAAVKCLERPMHNLARAST